MEDWSDFDQAPRRALRSKITMMKYLTRPSSQPALGFSTRHALHSVLAQQQYTTTVRGERGSAAALQQQQMETEMLHRVDSLTTALQSDANAKRSARFAARSKAARAAAAAEAHARKMGAVAPHRPAARGAALTIRCCSSAPRFIRSPEKEKAPPSPDADTYTQAPGGCSLPYGLKCDSKSIIAVRNREHWSKARNQNLVLQVRPAIRHATK